MNRNAILSLALVACTASLQHLSEHYWTSVTSSGDFLGDRTADEFVRLHPDNDNVFIAYWITRTKYDCYYEAFGWASFVDGYLIAVFVGKEGELVKISGGFRVLSCPRFRSCADLFEWIPAYQQRDAIGYIAYSDGLFAANHAIVKYKKIDSTIHFGDADFADGQLKIVEPSERTFFREFGKFNESIVFLHLGHPMTPPPFPYERRPHPCDYNPLLCRVRVCTGCLQKITCGDKDYYKRNLNGRSFMCERRSQDCFDPVPVTIPRFQDPYAMTSCSRARNHSGYEYFETQIGSRNPTLCPCDEQAGRPCLRMQSVSVPSHGYPYYYGQYTTPVTFPHYYYERTTSSPMNYGVIANPNDGDNSRDHYKTSGNSAELTTERQYDEYAEQSTLPPSKRSEEERTETHNNDWNSETTTRASTFPEEEPKKDTAEAGDDVDSLRSWGSSWS